MNKAQETDKAQEQAIALFDALRGVQLRAEAAPNNPGYCILPRDIVQSCEQAVANYMASGLPTSVFPIMGEDGQVAS